MTQWLCDVERITDSHAEKSGRHHADDIDELEVHPETRAGTQLATSHLPLPVIMAEDGHRRGARSRFICRLNQSTTIRLDTEAREEFPTHRDAASGSQITSLADPNLASTPGKHSGQRLLMVAQLLPDGACHPAVRVRVQAKTPIAADDSDLDELIWV